MKDTEEGRALKISARIMVAAGLCRYESATQCKRLYTDETPCYNCVRSWLLAKARKELKKEEQK
jgi:hypothetical protein